MPLGMARIGGLSLQVYVEGVVKANIGPMNVNQQIQTSNKRNSLKGLPQAYKPKVAQSFPVSVEDISYQ